jgi:hypothetical protein
MILVPFVRRQSLALARAICVWLLLALLPACAATPIPFSVPLRFGSDKLVEFPVELTRHRYYQIDIVFPFKDAEQRVDARKLAGEPTQNCEALSKCGVTPSFLVTVRRGADVLLREERTPIGIYAFSSNGFNRLIVKTLLRPAHYDIMVEVSHSPTELAGYDALIQFTTDSRSADLEN